MATFEKHLENLNPQQRQAVEATQGPVLVVAGPGTGKTQVLALRIANILKKHDVKPSDILCLTFTESGVLSMRNRLIKIIGNEAYYVRIHTFHSFCNEIILTFPEKFAFSTELMQLDDLTRLKVIKDVIDSFPDDVSLQLKPFHDKYYYRFDIISSIQTLKREGIVPSVLEKIARENLEYLENNKALNKRTGKPTGEWLTNYKSAERNFEIAEIYRKYNEILDQRGLYDYEDMILFVINKFAEDDELLAYYQEKFLYILVDEYQDTNGAQNQILKLLGSFDKSPNIFAVGDDDQAIFRFQGANVENLLFFEKQFENVKTIPITTNYRSSQAILDLSSKLIEHNKVRLVNVIQGLDKKLKAGLPLTNHKTEIYRFNTNDAENYFLTEKIKELVQNGYSYSDIAIIYRKHADIEDTLETLLTEEIPIQLVAGRNALDEKLIQHFLNLLRIIDFTDKNRDFLLFQVLFYEFLDFDRLDIFKLTTFASDKKISLFSLMLDETKLVDAGVEDIQAILKFSKQIVDWKAEAANDSLAGFVQKVAIESGFINYIFHRTNKDGFEDINSVNSFYDYIKNINRNSRKLTLNQFLNDINLIEENKIRISEKELDVNREGVNLLTAHKAKGLEFKVVFIMKFYNGNWGGRRNREIIRLPDEIYTLKEGQRHAFDVPPASSTPSLDEDERRLFFVALTRAKERLFLTYANEYPSGTSTKEVSPSIFLTELDEKLIENKNTEEYEKFSIEKVEKTFNAKVRSPFTIAEEEYLHSILTKFKLSASAMNEYIECPLKFKYNRLFKVPKVKDKRAAMGTAIHFVMEHFYKNLKNNITKDLDYMLYQYEWALNRELLSEEDLNVTLAEGKKIIEAYFEQYKDTFQVPAEVEYGFYGRSLLFEPPKIDPIPLSGKIDRVDWLNKEDLTVKIVDYKTMVPKSANDIKGLTKASDGAIYRQLVFYKLLSECDAFFKPNNTSAKYKVREVEVDFLKPNARGIFKKESFVISDEDLENLKIKIIDVMTRIRKLEFFGTEDYPLCGECEYCTL